MKGRAALARERIGGGGEGRAELAGSKSVEGAEAFGKFEDGGEATLAVEETKKVLGGLPAFLGVAFQAA